MQAQSSKAYLDRTQTKIAVHVIKCRRFSCESLWSWALLAGIAGVFLPILLCDRFWLSNWTRVGASQNMIPRERLLVCYTAVFRVVTQRSSPLEALRDDTKNGCVAD